MEYVIGIDGGGTKTKLTICDENRKILGTSVAGPSNILSSGYEVAKQSIMQVMDMGVVRQGFSLVDCRALCIGVAGGARRSVQEDVASIIRGTGYTGKTVVTHDAQTALMAGTDGAEGILMIAGTGSICYGINSSGKTCRVGGWGHLIDDEGSAYFISTHILNTIMRAYDGRSGPTKLTRLVLDYMELGTVEEIIASIYKPMMSKHHIAELSILIDEACEQEDRAAFDIVEEASDALFKHVKVAVRELGFGGKEFNIVINGSVIVSNKYINEAFCTKVGEYYPNAKVKALDHDASYGAALIAMNC
ncbi:MAG: hypothetical protein BEN18_00240 [Epulopiscium sp. Nuni2H_MBin001]|nr:MAG: hypothetical protein BEN18_00240 [Epulopiscium sp. Nuni2H_MBin001]